MSEREEVAQKIMQEAGCGLTADGNSYGGISALCGSPDCDCLNAADRIIASHIAPLRDQLAKVTAERDEAQQQRDYWQTKCQGTRTLEIAAEAALAAAQARIAELEAQLADLSRAADHDYWNQKDPHQ